MPARILDITLMEENDCVPLLNLSADELLTTTRSVRRRLDITRPVEPEIIRECLQIAVQAPTGGNGQNWHFVVVTDRQQCMALGSLYQRGFALYQKLLRSGQLVLSSRAAAPEQVATYRRVRSAAEYLAEHMHEMPALVVPCIQDRVDGQPVIEQAGAWGSILPATWSFMLAARARETAHAGPLFISIMNRRQRQSLVSPMST